MPTQNQPEIPEARETVVLMRPGVCDAIDDKKSGKCTGSRICLYSVVASVIVNVGLLSLVYILFKNGIVGCAELQVYNEHFHVLFDNDLYFNNCLFKGLNLKQNLARIFVCKYRFNREN